MSGHWDQKPRSGHGEQSPRRRRGGQYPGLWGLYHGVPVPYAGPSFRAASRQYAPAPASRQYAPAPASRQYASAPASRQYASAPASDHDELQFLASGPTNAEFTWCPSPAQPPCMDWQPPPLQFRHAGPYHEPTDSRQLSRQTPPPPGTSHKPEPPSYPPPPMPRVLSSPSPLLPLHGKRHLEEEKELPLTKRAKQFALIVRYTPVLEFLDKNPATESFDFKVGSLYGDIPHRADYYKKTTENGSTVLDGYVEHFSRLHADNKSYGGDFDVNDMLVSIEGPLHVTIAKDARVEATRLNIRKDLMKLINCLVKPRYCEDGKRPAYVDDFITRVQNLSPKTSTQQWEIKLWVIRHHPLLVETAKRRLVLEDFYKFYKTLNHRTAEQLIRSISKFCHRRWHVLIAPKDEFITNVYWKRKKQICPPDYRQRDYVAFPDENEENPDFYPFTSEDGYLAVFLRTFLVHGPEEAWDYGIELEELDLIIAHYFGKLLPTFLEELNSKPAKKYNTINEILSVYARRSSVSRRASG